MQPYKIHAIFMKQCKDTMKNTQILMLFIIYPIVAYMLTVAMPDNDAQVSMFIKIFATMHMVFAPVVTTTNIISEEKEKNTLRVLIMSNVSAVEYLLGIGSFVFLCTGVGTLFFVLLGGYQGEAMIIFLASMMLGTICSILLGFTVGILARNQMAATAVTVPVGLLLAFLPMLSTFNTSIEKFASITYSQQISYLLEKPVVSGFTLHRVLPIGINFMVIAIFFYIIFRRKGIKA